MVSIGRTSTKGRSGLLKLTSESVKDATPGTAATWAGRKIAEGLSNTVGGRSLNSLGDTAMADSKPKMPRGGSDVGRTQQRRGSAKAAMGASSGSITKPDAKATAAKKASGDAYLSQSATDYGVGSAVNSFANKKTKK